MINFLLILVFILSALGIALIYFIENLRTQLRNEKYQAKRTISLIRNTSFGLYGQSTFSDVLEPDTDKAITLFMGIGQVDDVDHCFCTSMAYRDIAMLHEAKERYYQDKVMRTITFKIDKELFTKENKK